MKEILQAPFIIDFVDNIDNMYRLGWDERNAGNISYLLTEEEVARYLDLNHVERTFDFGFDVSPLIGKLFLVTGSGKYFKNVKKNIPESIGIIRINSDGHSANIIWGFAGGGRPTSEISTHLLSHIERLKIDHHHRVIMHTHASNLIAMSFVEELNDKEFTKSLWRMNTECIIVFPDGVGVIPWMVCGNKEIGLITAKKFRETRIIIWTMHGVFASGTSLDEAFGLIETAEKAAQTYMLLLNLPVKRNITDDQLLSLAKAFGVQPKTDFFE